MSIRLLSIFLFIAMCNVYSFGQIQTKDFDYGHIENNKYINRFFNFEISLPPDWVIQNKEEMERLAETGKALVAGDDQKMKAILQASTVNTANLLMAFQYEQGAPVEYNPGLLIVVENIKHLPGIKSGKDYLFQARKLMAQSQMPYDHIDKESLREEISDADFYTMNVDINTLGVKIMQKYYVTNVNGFSLIIIASFIDKKQQKILTKSIKSLRFLK